MISTITFRTISGNKQFGLLSEFLNVSDQSIQLLIGDIEKDRPTTLFADTSPMTGQATSASI
jgi:hypothetical protein